MESFEKLDQRKMTNPRRVYFRKKLNSIIIEGKRHGKSVYIWTLPKDPEQFLKKLIDASFFPKDKCQEIMTLLSGLDYKPSKGERMPQEVPTTIIKRTPKKDAIDIDEEVDFVRKLKLPGQK